ncbi:ABC1 kinase family protein [Microbacterium lushaniae]|uniref:AarF/ABC1/UbiB kinase family protein n=1 Tax=Microbacterium lushaniae TaxID=2614639 RepID=A0A5J6L0G6_9MICO|nr:AarF/UbiB family protein [Microbacterium lushaniae]QEW01965.1 AarF/ABC1/UbiB kinase family protein [Microbacterium lushaniae]
MATWLLAALLTCAFIVGLSLLVRWILGVPVRFLRSVGAGIAASFVVLPLVFVTVGAVGGVDLPALADGDLAIGETATVLLALVWVLCLSAALLVSAELLRPSASTPGLIAVARSARDRARRAARYVEVTRIALRHGLGPLLQGRPAGAGELAPALVAALTEAGVVFVKFGQALAARRDLVPASLADGLTSLQAQVLPEPWPVMERTLADELRRPIPDVFAHVEPVPVAAASVGQVHAATLVTGEHVVVKIQRPDTARQVDIDVDIALRLCARIERRSGLARQAGLLRIAQDLTALLRQELDFTVEAANLQLLTAAGEDAATAPVLPRLYPQASGRRVLTVERLSGAPLAARPPALAALAPEARRRAAVGIVDGVVTQLLVRGILHADLHAGNIMLRDDGTVGLIDFGSVVVLDREQRDLLTALFAAFRAEDAASAVAIVRHLSPAADRAADWELRRDIGRLFTIGAVSTDTHVLIDGLLRILRRHGVALPGNLAAAMRSLATLQDAVEVLDPTSDFASLFLERAHVLTTAQRSAERLRLEAASRGLAMMQMLRRAPDRLDLLLDARVRGATDGGRREAALRRSWLARAGAAIGGAALTGGVALAALLLLLSGGGPVLPPGVPLLPLIGAALCPIALVVGLRTSLAVRNLGAEPA